MAVSLNQLFLLACCIISRCAMLARFALDRIVAIAAARRT